MISGKELLIGIICGIVGMVLSGLAAAFISNHQDIAPVATHLMSGSFATLGALAGVAMARIDT